MSINVTIANGVAKIEMARPEKKNALSLAMYEAMTGAVQEALAEHAVRALLITGQPGVFTAGNDLEDFAKRPPTGDDSPVIGFMRALQCFDKPVIAAVSGVAVGIGVTMLLHCDLVYVSNDARFALPFVSLGLVPEFASSWLLPRLIGRVRASEILLLGESFTAAAAVEMGIANAAFPAADVLPQAMRVAERLAALPPGAMRSTKRLIRDGMAQTVANAMHAENEIFVQRLASSEAAEAFAAFLERRPPDFSGF